MPETEIPIAARDVSIIEVFHGPQRGQQKSVWDKAMLWRPETEGASLYAQFQLD